MKRMTGRRRLILLSVIATVLSATAWVNLPGETNYVVNINSFGTGFSALGGDPTQAIQYAAQHWAAYAGSYRLFRRSGFTTTMYNCQLGMPNVVEGFPNKVPGDPSTCGTAAQAQTGCVGAGWVIQVAGCANHTLGYPSITPPRSDFHLTLTHEFGHWLLHNGAGVDSDNDGVPDGHLPASTDADDTTIMAGGAGANISAVFSGFGSQDVFALGGPGYAAYGDGYVNAAALYSVSSGWPTPTSFGNLNSTQQARWVGFGGFDYLKGAAGDEFFVSGRVTPEPHRMESSTLLGPDAATANNSAFALGVALVHDTTRNNWWSIVRDASHHNYAHLMKWQLLSGTYQWVDLGAIPDIVSRYPVGAAYSWSQDRIVVVWSNSRGDCRSAYDSSFNCTGRRTGWGTQPFGCQGEYLVTLIDPSNGVRVSTTRFITGGDPGKPGYTGLGAPSVACEADICEVFVTARDPSRSIISWAFVPSQTGVTSYFNQVSQAGSTDFAVSTSTLPAGGGNRVLVQAVLGRDDRRAYFRTRQYYWNNWSGWVSIQPYYQFVTTPRVRIDSQNSNFIFVAGY